MSALTLDPSASPCSAMNDNLKSSSPSVIATGLRVTNDLSLATLSAADLEILKTHLDAARQQIVLEQNARSPLLRLPGELRNRIFLTAMYMELLERKHKALSSVDSVSSGKRRGQLFGDPAFFKLCRQIRMECKGLWMAEVVIWEEWHVEKRGWQVLSPQEIRKVCCNWESQEGQEEAKLLLERSCVTLERTRAAVEDSSSICRRGLVRVIGADVVLPQLRWWLW